MMRTIVSVSLGLAFSVGAFANEVMTPEKLWELKRVSALGLNKDKTHVIYKVTTPSIENNSFDSKVYQVSLKGGDAQLLESYQGVVIDKSLSPDGTKKTFPQKKFSLKMCLQQIAIKSSAKLMLMCSMI
ncbi:hypothetical protein [Pseudoalteromonas phenolica]|uniref:hypothetical protein n=1 Tax=Pseudoalteromonas phenolica TaxID=161398 RepID=UPI001F503E47|nr:hypothetical protein [Pseudoalteromonas phenolica]